MSDDRFKQARRSLIDRHNQRQQQGGGQGQDTFDGDFEDEATAMVNLDGTPHQFAPPPNFEGDERTEMISVDQAAYQQQDNGVQIRSHSGVQPSYQVEGGQPQQQFAGQQGSEAQHQFAGQPPSGPQQGGEQPGGQQQFAPPSQQELSGQSPQQSLVIGGGGGDFEEGNTQFVNLNDFATGAESFVPDDSAAGYEGSTQFVNLNALQAGAAAGGQMPVEHDPILKENYQFGPESIQEGEFTLIFAQNTQGRPVILKRIWEGDPNGMPMPVRQRVAALDQIRHPRLIALNGMLTSQSGAWVELNRPPGYRLTDIIQQNGPQAPDTVKEWMTQTADILGTIHQQGFVYANLTTDAIWVQEDGTVLLEPFDVLSFEHRGNLGAFGPPEMNFPPEQRQLYPATDIYCLAAVTAAALTGLPLNLGLAGELPKKIGAAVQQSLHQNPQERPQSAAEFIERLDKSGGGLPDLNMKVVIAAVALLGFGGLGVAYYMQNTAAPPPVEGNAGAAVAGDPVAEGDPEGAMGEEGLDPAAGEEGLDPAEGEGADLAPIAVGVEQDPRLTIETSFSINPPAEVEAADPEPNNEEANAVRAEAKELLDGIETLVKSQQEEKYQLALQKAAEAIRLSGGPTPADERLIEDLFEVEIVQTIQRDYFERIHEGLENENVSRAKATYSLLAGVDASAEEANFFNKNKGVSISKVERSGSAKGSEDAEEESEE